MNHSDEKYQLQMSFDKQQSESNADTVYSKVLNILRKYPRTRSSDKDLIWMFIAGSEAATFITKTEFNDIPAFESITRARRKAQEIHPELAAAVEVQAERAAKEETKGNFIFNEQI